MTAGEPRGEAAASSRLDHWLDVACLFKTRAEAQRACRAGRVSVNGQPGRASRQLRAGDVLRIGRGTAGEQILVVKGFARSHVSKAEARKLYEDQTPPPPPEKLEARRIERLLRQQSGPPPGAPDSRDRRLLRRLRGKS